jgi:UrcA family protein
MKTTSSHTSLIACAVIAGAFTVGFVSGPAMADPQHSGSFKFEFQYEPTELTTLTTAEKLLVRLERDVRSYCGNNRKMTLDEKRYVNECVTATMKESIAKFDSEAVAQAFRSRADG